MYAIGRARIKVHGAMNKVIQDERGCEVQRRARGRGERRGEKLLSLLCHTLNLQPLRCDTAEFWTAVGEGAGVRKLQED
jgi:hypothetical protein